MANPIGQDTRLDFVWKICILLLTVFFFWEQFPFHKKGQALKSKEIALDRTIQTNTTRETKNTRALLHSTNKTDKKQIKRTTDV